MLSKSVLHQMQSAMAAKRAFSPESVSVCHFVCLFVYHLCSTELAMMSHDDDNFPFGLNTPD